MLSGYLQRLRRRPRPRGSRRSSAPRPQRRPSGPNSTSSTETNLVHCGKQRERQAERDREEGRAANEENSDRSESRRKGSSRFSAGYTGVHQAFFGLSRNASQDDSSISNGSEGPTWSGMNSEVTPGCDLMDSSYSQFGDAESNSDWNGKEEEEQSEEQPLTPEEREHDSDADMEDIDSDTKVNTEYPWGNWRPGSPNLPHMDTGNVSDAGTYHPPERGASAEFRDLDLDEPIPADNPFETPGTIYEDEIDYDEDSMRQAIHLAYSIHCPYVSSPEKENDYLELDSSEEDDSEENNRQTAANNQTPPLRSRYDPAPRTDGFGQLRPSTIISENPFSGNIYPTVPS